jgi:hypothetical protein
VNLSNSFTLEQLTFSETAIRRNIDNTPTPDQIENLRELAQNLERIQQILGSPLNIHSGFRTPKVNAAVGGSSTSAHMDGFACDFACPGFGTALEVCKAVAGANIPYDQIIFEGTWCHFSCDHRMRGMLLTAHFGGGPATYTNGLP